jgi:predicted aspartyl protease
MMPRDLPPPAPVAFVSLSNLETNVSWEDVPMLLDTGADVSLVPQATVRRLGLTVGADKQYELMTFNGSTSFAPFVQLKQTFLGKTFRGQFLLIDQDVGILGHNVLNAVALVLDGPNVAWDELHA